MKRTILVTDGEQRSALAAVRSLGRTGHRVLVCSNSGRSLAGASRFADDDIRVASALGDPAAFARDVAGIIAQRKVDVLLPMTEQSFNAVFANQSLIEATGVCIPAASAEQFRAISDKQRVLDVAASCGLSVPAQVVLATPTDGASLRESAVRFPLVVKPARSVAQDRGQQVKLGVAHCADWSALQRVIKALPDAAYPLLLQQRVIGPGIGIFLLVWDGELVATFAHRRLREKPPAGGVSVYRESVAADSGLVAKSRQLLDRFGWQGVAMIEFKVDEATGTPYIMEINGRFWGSLQLAIDAGVDFPSLLVARALGESVTGPDRYRLGVRSKWEWGEVDHLLARLRRSDAELSLPPGSPSRLRSILSVVLPWRPGDKLEVLRLSDLRPFLRESIQYFRSG